MSGIEREPLLSTPDTHCPAACEAHPTPTCSAVLAHVSPLQASSRTRKAPPGKSRASSLSSTDTPTSLQEREEWVQAFKCVADIPYPYYLFVSAWACTPIRKRSSHGPATPHTRAEAAPAIRRLLVHITVDCRPRHTRCMTQDQTLRARNARTSAGLPRMYERVGCMCPHSFPPLPFPLLHPSTLSLLIFPSHSSLSLVPLTFLPALSHIAPRHQPIAQSRRSINAPARSVYPGVLPVQTRAWPYSVSPDLSARCAAPAVRTLHNHLATSGHTQAFPILSLSSTLRPFPPDSHLVLLHPERLRRLTASGNDYHKTQAHLCAPRALRDCTARLPDTSRKAMRFGSTDPARKIRLTPDSDYTPAPASIPACDTIARAGRHLHPFLYFTLLLCSLPPSLAPSSRLGRADLKCDGSRTSALALAHPEFGFDSTSSPVHPSLLQRAHYLHTLLLLVSSPYLCLLYLYLFTRIP
ncbi:hypothetical protein B0H14DRAFT_3463544 [Mycena olivaceomarginata]|nr:hypothetical protein B0H14DRAFT_3463544 [Mycena olivaceomarginata]